MHLLKRWRAVSHFRHPCSTLRHPKCAQAEVTAAESEPVLIVTRVGVSAEHFPTLSNTGGAFALQIFLLLQST